MGKTARQNKQEFINPTESEQDSDTQIHKPSFRLISSLENTMLFSANIFCEWHDSLLRIHTFKRDRHPQPIPSTDAGNKKARHSRAGLSLLLKNRF